MKISKKKEVKTVAEVGEYKGNELFQIWELDDEGQRKSEYPLVSLGAKKLEMIIKHIDEAKEFLS